MYFDARIPFKSSVWSFDTIFKVKILKNDKNDKNAISDFLTFLGIDELLFWW